MQMSIARVRSEAVFPRNAANVARKNSLVLNVVGRPGSKLSQQLGVERTEIFCLYWPHLIKFFQGGGVRARKKERKRVKVRAQLSTLTDKNAGRFPHSTGFHLTFVCFCQLLHPSMCEAYCRCLYALRGI